MEKYSYIIGEDFTCLVNTSNGNSVTKYSSETDYENFINLINLGDYVGAERLGDVKIAVNKFLTTAKSDRGMEFRITDDSIEFRYTEDDLWQTLHNSISSRIIAMAKADMNITPMLNFMENLLGNPSKQSVDELYMFLEATRLPITEDGYFIAYKLVRGDYKDIHSGEFDNSVGQYLSMPRNEVDDRRHNTCSTGFHFCSKEYLPHYGSTTSSKCVLVKINPEDVVSIPSDYNNAKGRCCAYEVVGELKDWQNLRNDNSDYTDSPVVRSDNPHEEWNAHDYFEDNWESVSQRIFQDYFLSPRDDVWKEISTGDWVARIKLAEEFDTTVEMIEYIEEKIA